MDALQPWHSQPIFVTSTFQDMQAERDHLLTHVFPALEEWLATKRRYLEWVDLRVGVSATAEDEESRELKILNVCLDEVRRSRPFLIALIGDRYGWVPQFERASTAAAEIGYRTNVAGRSVMELEVDFGALHDPEQGRRSLVFFRAPLPYHTMPPETAALYCDGMDTRPDAPLRVARLAQLKTRLREQIPQRCFDYRVEWDHEANRVTGLDSWGRMVEAQLRMAFKREFGEDEAPRELGWIEAEAQALENFIGDRTRGFVGRATTLQHLERITTAPASEDGSWGACISAEPGAGKTALFGELWKRVRDGGAVTLVHAVGASIDGPWIGFMLRRFIAELMVHADSLDWFRFTEEGEIWNRGVLDAAQAPDATEEQLYTGFGQLLSWAAAKRRVIVLIDAMDQFDEFAQAAFAAWVREHWPPNARLVVTTTPRAPAAASLAEIGAIVAVPVPALIESEARAIAAAVCARYHRQLPQPVMEALIARRGGDGAAWALPLWLVLATEELNLLDADDFARARHLYEGTDHERITALMCHLVAEMPDDVQGLYRAGLSRSETLFGRELSSGFLGAIAASPAGLRESDFRVLLPALSGIAWDELQFAQLRRLFRGQLRRREPLGRWDSSHRQMRIAVRRWLAEIGVDTRTLHAAIADHLLALPADDPVRISDAVLHLLDSEDWARAATYLAALEDDQTSRTALTALVEQLRAPADRTREETARRLGLMLTVPGLDDVSLSRVATRIVDVHVRVQGRCSLAAEQIMLTAVDAALRGLTARHPDDRAFLAQHARCLHFLGHLRKDAGDLEGAISTYLQVQEIDRRLVQPGNDGTSDQRQFNASVSIGDALFSRGDLQGALACYRDPANTGSDVALGRVGVILRLQGDYDGALAAMREGIQILERQVEQNPRDQRLRFHLGQAHSAIASTLADKGDLGHALQSYNVAMKLVSQTATQNPMDPHVQSEWGVMHLRIGSVLRKLLNVDAAMQYVQRGIVIMRRILDVHGENPGYRRYFAVLEMELGDLHQLLGHDEEAVVHWSAARAEAERLAAEDPANAEWQRDLAVIVARLAFMLRTPEVVDAALGVLRNGKFGVWERELRETRASIEQLALAIREGRDRNTTVGSEPARSRVERTPPAKQLLDLSVHDPEHYEGKIVEWNGGCYIVGDRRDGDAEHSIHGLINERSQLSLFVIKILTRPRPRGIYTEQLSVLRADPDLARLIPITLEVDVPGGMVEFHPNVASPGRSDGAIEHVRKGFAALTKTNPSPGEAQTHFAEALRINPFHTEAMYGMARALWLADAAFDALPIIRKAVDLEPNAFHYRRTHIQLVHATQQYAFGIHLYREVTRLFENVHDLDELATEILLDAGKPEEAKQCVAGAVVSDGRRVELEKAVDDAVRARARALELMHAARGSVMAKDWSAASSALLRAQEIYKRDAELCMNTAFASLHEGNPRICAALMLHASNVVSEPLAAVCAANAGIAMLKAHDLEGAMTILDIAARRLSWLHGGEIPANEIDLPSVGVWIEGDTMIQERVSVAEEFISTGLAQAAAQGVSVPDRVRTLAAAYYQAAAAAR